MGQQIHKPKPRPKPSEPDGPVLRPSGKPVKGT